MADVVVKVELTDPGAALQAAISEAAVAQVDNIVKKFDFNGAVGTEIQKQIDAMIAAEVGDKLTAEIGQKLKDLVNSLIAPPAAMPADKPAKAVKADA